MHEANQHVQVLLWTVWFVGVAFVYALTVLSHHRYKYVRISRVLCLLLHDINVQMSSSVSQSARSQRNHIIILMLLCCCASLGMLFITAYSTQLFDYNVGAFMAADVSDFTSGFC